MNRTLKLILTGLAVISLAGISMGQKVVEAIIAIVNDEVITISEFKTQYDTMYEAMRAQTGGGEEFTRTWIDYKKTILDTMITNKLLIQEGRKLRINLDEAVRESMERIKEDYNITTDAEFVRALQQQGLSYEQFRKQMEDNILMQQVIRSEVGMSIVLDDAELVDYYKKNPEEFVVPAQYKVRAIYIAGEGKSADEIEAKKSEIDQKLDAGEDMAAVASEHSEGPEKETGGDIGTMVSGQMASELEDVVKELQDGEIAPWIEFRGGWFRMKLEEKTESTLKTFEDARKDIEQKMYGQLQQEKTLEYLKRLKARSYIKILVPNPENLY